MNRIKFSFVVTLLTVSLGCGSNSLKYPIVIEEKSSDDPIKVVKSFFNSSGKINEKDMLVSTYPEKFVECLFMTVQECTTKREQLKIGRTKSENDKQMPRLVSIESPEKSIKLETYKNRIVSKQIYLKQIISEWTTENESRVRILIEIEGKEKIKDLLLFKDNKWKIFEIANENEYLYYSTPSNNST